MCIEKSRELLVEQKLKLTISCSFRCDQIYNSRLYEFGRNLFCYLSLTEMLDKPASGCEHGHYRGNIYIIDKTPRALSWC
jgi:hypothetical protein